MAAEWNSVFFPRPPEHLLIQRMASDASGSWGSGPWYGPHWFQPSLQEIANHGQGTYPNCVGLRSVGATLGQLGGVAYVITTGCGGMPALTHQL